MFASCLINVGTAALAPRFTCMSDPQQPSPPPQEAPRLVVELLVDFLPDAAPQTFAVAGTPDECQARLREYLSIGLDEPIIEVSGSATGGEVLRAI